MPFVLYSLWRLALILGAAAILYLLGLRSWLLAAVAVVIALCASYVFLNGPRTRAAAYFAERRLRRQQLDDARVAARSDDEESEDAQLEESSDSQDEAPGDNDAPGAASHP